ncbi:MAG: aspartate/glutamate racemase family protein [Pseudomonadota bacterium]
MSRPGPILVINPNSNPAVTEGLSHALDPLRLSGAPEIETMTLAEGPFGIESQIDSDAVVLPLVSVVRARSDVSALVIACYSDPGLEACRAAASVPVFGMQESGILTALSRGDQVGVIALSTASIARHRRYLRRMGVSERIAGEYALDMSVDESARGAHVAEALATAGAALLSGGADVLVLGCAGMAAHRRALQERLGVPVVEPVQAAVAMALGSVLGD